MMRRLFKRASVVKVVKIIGIVRVIRSVNVHEDGVAAQLGIDKGPSRRRRGRHRVCYNFVEIDHQARCHNLHSSVERAGVVEIRVLARMITFETHE